MSNPSLANLSIVLSQQPLHSFPIPLTTILYSQTLLSSLRRPRQTSLDDISRLANEFRIPHHATPTDYEPSDLPGIRSQVGQRARQCWRLRSDQLRFRSLWPLMSAAVRSPKIPLSPSSPPETGLKRRRQSDSTEKPPTPPYMSVATKSYVSSYGHTSHSDETASRSSPRSPSSSSSYAQQATQRDSQAYSTPASSTGIPGLSMTEDSDQHRNKRQKMELDTREAPDMMQVDQSTRPTNHERNEHVDTSFSVDSDDTSLDQLQKDMGDAFLLGRSSKALCSSLIPITVY